MNTQIHHPLQSLVPIVFHDISALRVGDEMWRQLAGFTFLVHYGCFAGFDYLGPWVFHHTKNGTELVPYENFASGYQVFFKAIKDHERPAAVMRMRELLANKKQYTELGFNCEHAKNYVTKGRAYSPQSLICVAIVAAGFFALVREGKAA